MTPEVEGELPPADEEGHDDQDDADGDDVDEGREDIEPDRPLHAREHDEMHGPDEERPADDRMASSCRRRRWEEIAEHLHDQHGEGDIAEGRAEPVAPGHLEARERAEALLRIAIDPGFQIGALVGQGAEGVGEKEHADERDDPGDRHGAQRRVPGHVLRQIEGAAADHRADDDAGQKDSVRSFAARSALGLFAGGMAGNQ